MPSSMGVNLARQFLNVGTKKIDMLDASLRKKIEKMTENAEELKMLSQYCKISETALRDKIYDFYGGSASAPARDYADKHLYGDSASAPATPLKV